MNSPLPLDHNREASHESDETKAAQREISAGQFEAHVLRFYTMSDPPQVTVQPATQLLFDPGRFDYLIKYLYVASVSSGLQSRWFHDLYDEHMKYFNNYHEANFPGRSTAADFRHKFDQLIELAPRMSNQFFLLPVDQNGCLLDGAHRLAIAAYHGRSVTTVELKPRFLSAGFRFDYRFFLNKGLPAKFTNFTARQYARLCKESRLLILFPSCLDQWHSFDGKIHREADVYYRADIELGEMGRSALIDELYRNETWLNETLNGVRGGEFKTQACFRGRDRIRVYLLRSQDASALHALKTSLRESAGFGNHSVHSTDSNGDTARIADMVLHNPPLSCFPSHKPQMLPTPTFDRLIHRFTTWLSVNKLNQDAFCLAGSAVLAAYGLRDCRDLDFLVEPTIAGLPQLPASIECHNAYITGNGFDRYLGSSIADLIWDPEFHVVLGGLKFLHPRVVRRFKTIRGEPKDAIDVELLERFFGASFQDATLVLPNHVDPEWYPRLDNRFRQWAGLQSDDVIRLNAPFDWATCSERDRLAAEPEVLREVSAVFQDCRFVFEVFQKLDAAAQQSLFASLPNAHEVPPTPMDQGISPLLLERVIVEWLASGSRNRTL